MTKILLYDLETAPNLVANHNIWDPTPYGNVIQERYIICASWKWLGESEVHSKSVGKDHVNDRPVLKSLCAAIERADMLVGHNADKFDLPWINTRRIFHGMQPLPPIQQVDTLKIAKRRFYFNSRRLDYLAAFLGVGKKQKITGDVWLACMRGERPAIREMVKYNVHDVNILEKVYLKLRPYATTHVNRALGVDDACPRCGSHKTLRPRGFAAKLTVLWRRFQCSACGAWSQRPARGGQIR